MAHPNRLADAHVVVFGGTSGIGFGVANMALSNNAFVTISGSTQSKVDDKVALLRSFYPSLAPAKITGFAVNLLDVANLEANLKTFFEKATKNGEKKIDHIAFTAGDPLSLPKIEDASVETFHAALTVRNIAPSLVAKLLSTGAYMPLTASSSLTLTGGTNTSKPMPGWWLGAALGGMTVGLTRGLAVDLRPIRVNIVEPGMIRTEALDRWMKNLGEEKVRTLERRTVTGTIGSVEDVSEAYGWCMRDRYASGVQAQSDGGRLIAVEEFVN